MNIGNLATGYAFTFAATDLPGAQDSEFASIFRMYRIDQVDVMFCPVATCVTAEDLVTGGRFTQMTSVAICYDDNLAPATESDVLQYENCTLHPTIGAPWTVSLKPRAKLDTNNINSIPIESPWIDTGNLTVAHHGIKVWNPIIGGANAAQTGIEMYVRYHMSFRTVC